MPTSDAYVERAAYIPGRGIPELFQVRLIMVNYIN